ncbi:hypothetical protein ABWH93_17760 [Seohaeicola saemankumensis]|uniref:hypothetical protein n=1 Tax=Seohaeicola saemankumensis TaxID=481181 RepID=UPI0035CF9AA2
MNLMNRRPRNHAFPRGLVPLALSAVVMVSMLHVPGTAVAQDGLPPDWCRLDAPGLWRDLREKARAAGTREVGDCPAGGIRHGCPNAWSCRCPVGAIWTWSGSIFP